MPSEAVVPRGRPYRPFSSVRVGAIARNTLTQLVRQRAFYFLLVFSLFVLIAALLIENFTYEKERELKVVKDMSFFAMSIFCTVFAVTATANLIPTDIEDRTLYTILAKPVPRWEYLIGKYAGGILVIIISAAVLTLLLCGVLYVRQQAIHADEEALFRAGAVSADEFALFEQKLAKEGLSWNLLNASVAICLQAMVLAALTLFVSTFASSGLFTVIVGFILYLVGYIQPVVIDYWRTAGDLGRPGAFLLYLFEIALPNFQTFNIVDGIVAGERLPPGVLTKMLGVGAGYVAAFLVAAQLVFMKKEL